MEQASINMEIITVEDCIELYAKKGIITVCNDGAIVELKPES